MVVGERFLQQGRLVYLALDLCSLAYSVLHLALDTYLAVISVLRLATFSTSHLSRGLLCRLLSVYRRLTISIRTIEPLLLLNNSSLVIPNGPMLLHRHMLAIELINVREGLGDADSDDGWISCGRGSHNYYYYYYYYIP